MPRGPIPNGRRRQDGPVGRFLHRALEFFSQSIWEVELARLGRLHKWLFKLARVVFLATRGFVQDRCVVRAAALTYVTVLSIVPLLAVVFATVKGLGFYDDFINGPVETFLDRAFPGGGDKTVSDPKFQDAEVARGDEPSEVLRIVSQDDPAADTAVEPEDPVATEVAETNSPPLTEEEVDEAQAAALEENVASDVKDLRGTIEDMLAFVQKTNFGKIGTTALLLFLYTVIKMLGTVEKAFNEIWGVTRSRSFIRKVSDYLSMVLVTPVLIVAGGSAVAATQARAKEWGVGGVVETLISLGAWVPVLIGFTFLILLMPNTRVRFTSALLGGAVSSALWIGVLVAYGKFQVGVSNANAIYGTLAAVPIFLVFVNLCWIVVLVGAELAFAHQSEPTYREVERPYPSDHAVREVIALRCAARIARRFVVGDPPPTPSELALELAVPVRPVQEVLARLAESGVLAETDRDEDVAYLPARPLDVLRIVDVLEALGGHVYPEDTPARSPVDARLDRMLVRITERAAESEDNLTLRELAELPDHERGADTEAEPEAQRADELRGQGSARSATT